MYYLNIYSISICYYYYTKSKLIESVVTFIVYLLSLWYYTYVSIYVKSILFVTKLLTNINKYIYNT